MLQRDHGESARDSFAATEVVIKSPLTQIGLLLTMKLCSQAVNSYISVLDPKNFNWTDGSCIFKPASVSENHVPHFLNYLLPVLGGLLSTAFLRYISVLQLGGLAFLTASVLMAIASNLGWLCEYPQYCLILWILPSLAAGIVEPVILYGIIRWQWQRPGHLTVLFALLLFFENLGEQLGTQPASITALKFNHHLWGIAASAVYTIVSICLQDDGQTSRPAIPTRSRMLRYVKIFSALTPFVLVVSDERLIIYVVELKHLGNISVGDLSLSFESPFALKTAGYLSASLVTIVLAHFWNISTRARIYASIVLELAVSTFLTIFTAVVPLLDSMSGWLLRDILLLMSLCDGVAGCIASIAYFELFDSITSRSSKLIVSGILLSVLGVGGVLSCLLHKAFVHIPTDNPIASPVDHKAPLLFVYHASTVLLLSISLFYHKFLAFPMAEMLEPAAEEDDY